MASDRVRRQDQRALPAASAEAILHQFPFRLQGFPAGNGSEHINATVAKLLEKLLIEFTKSRANRSQDPRWWKAKTER